MPHYALVTSDGEALGAVELAGHDWQAGHVIYRGGEPNLRVIDRIDSDDPETYTVLVVEPA